MLRNNIHCCHKKQLIFFAFRQNLLVPDWIFSFCKYANKNRSRLTVDSDLPVCLSELVLGIDQLCGEMQPYPAHWFCQFCTRNIIQCRFFRFVLDTVYSALVGRKNDATYCKSGTQFTSSSPWPKKFGIRCVYTIRGRTHSRKIHWDRFFHENLCHALVNIYGKEWNLRFCKYLKIWWCHGLFIFWESCFWVGSFLFIRCCVLWSMNAIKITKITRWAAPAQLGLCGWNICTAWERQ